jgi:hypothetical protein
MREGLFNIMELLAGIVVFFITLFLLNSCQKLFDNIKTFKGVHIDGDVMRKNGVFG